VLFLCWGTFVHLHGVWFGLGADEGREETSLAMQGHEKGALLNRLLCEVAEDLVRD
jgi:hypothetical protein